MASNTVANISRALNNLTDSEQAVLAYLVRSGKATAGDELELSVSGLVRTTGLDRASLYRIICRLTYRGVIEEIDWPAHNKPRRYRVLINIGQATHSHQR